MASFDAKVVAHDFERGDRPPPIFGSRRCDTIQRMRFGQSDADLLFFRLVEHADDTVDRLAGIDRVQCAHDQVAGFRGRHADFDRFAVAHFADENDFGSLAQRSAKSGGERAEVVSHFPLVERRLLLRMDEFDRIFERDDVNRFRFRSVRSAAPPASSTYRFRLRR